jgi:hypothetical protein
MALAAARARRVPFWAAAGFAAFDAVMGAMVTMRLAPPQVQTASAVTADRTVTLKSHLRLAFDALHLLTHAAIEAQRRAEAPRAFATLWFVVASQFGLAFTE